MSTVGEVRAALGEKFAGSVARNKYNQIVVRLELYQRDVDKPGAIADFVGRVNSALSKGETGLSVREFGMIVKPFTVIDKDTPHSVMAASHFWARVGMNRGAGSEEPPSRVTKKAA